MATPPTPFQIRSSEFPSAPANAFVLPFNTFTNQVVQALTGRLTIDNAAALLKTVDVPASGTSVTFAHGLSVCSFLSVANVLDSATALNKLGGCVAGDWRDNGDGTVTVSGITGLPSNASKVTFLCA